MENEIIKSKKKKNESLLNELNDMQKKAADQIDGAILILAGAGTGKTKTVTYRIANMVENYGISPYSILAVTFTNKAANEMKERITSLIGEKARKCTISTFHSFGLKLLRIYYNYVGYKDKITVYDTDDQKKVIAEIDKKYNFLKQINIDVGNLLSLFGNFKEKEMTAEEIEMELEFNPKKNLILDLYNYYNSFLKESNAVDFSDILLLTKKLLDIDQILEKVQSRYKYIMVDEYQDTNQIQFRIIKLIASKLRNICVVGDDNQSIYKFRGADISNILSFTKTYPDATTIKLEQNYRSTKVIIDTSNKVIENNKAKTDKKLWTANEKGELIKIFQCNDNYAEGKRIAEEIRSLVKKGYKYRDITILYRTNAQSRVFEDNFLNNSIPYKIYGGLSFYDRMEIKDMIGFLKLFYNSDDDIALLRVLNTPKRRIGDVSMELLREFAERNNLSLFNALKYASEIKKLTKIAKQEMEDFYYLVKKFQRKMEDGYEMANLLSQFLEEIYYYNFMKNDIRYTENYEDRCENIEEFKNLISEFENQNVNDEDRLGALLEDISLKKDNKDDEENLNAVKLMTIHNSKGLEFPVVFLVGMIDGLFPSFRCMSEEDIEEERRVYYVAITRAKKLLYLSYFSTKKSYNKETPAYPSEFLGEIPNSNIQVIKEKFTFKNNIIDVNDEEYLN